MSSADFLTVSICSTSKKLNFEIEFGPKRTKERTEDFSNVERNKDMSLEVRSGAQLTTKDGNTDGTSA